jgi:hypothetical protein
MRTDKLPTARVGESSKGNGRGGGLWHGKYFVTDGDPAAGGAPPPIKSLKGTTALGGAAHMRHFSLLRNLPQVQRSTPENAGRKTKRCVNDDEPTILPAPRDPSR